MVRLLARLILGRTRTSLSTIADDYGEATEGPAWGNWSNRSNAITAITAIIVQLGSSGHNSARCQREQKLLRRQAVWREKGLFFFEPNVRNCTVRCSKRVPSRRGVAGSQKNIN